MKINEYEIIYLNVTHLSMHIFSTCGTKTCSKRIMVCNGTFARHVATHSGVGVQYDASSEAFDVETRILPRYKIIYHIHYMDPMFTTTEMHKNIIPD